jgi:alanyl-tRNA synthetase
VASGAALVIVNALDGWDTSGLKAIATHIAAQANAAVALFSSESPHAVVITRSPGVALDAMTVLGALIERFGGRGGGKADLAQGGGFSGDLPPILAATRQLLESGLLSVS